MLRECLQFYRAFSNASGCSACPWKQFLLYMSATVSELPSCYCAISSGTTWINSAWCCFVMNRPCIHSMLQNNCSVPKSLYYIYFSTHPHLCVCLYVYAVSFTPALLFLGLLSAHRTVAVLVKDVILRNWCLTPSNVFFTFTTFSSCVFSYSYCIHCKTIILKALQAAKVMQ